jgi:hypothetical protein
MRSTLRLHAAPLAAAIGLAAGALLLSACGSSGKAATTSPTGAGAGTTVASGGSGPTTPVTAAPIETNPPGDIPDTTHYVTWASPDGKVKFNHPEGWAQTSAKDGVRFADKLNSITVTTSSGPVPTVASANSRFVPALVQAGGAVQVISTAAATLPAGPAVKITWRVNSAPDAVTGRVYRDEVITYLVGVHNRVVRMDLSGAVGSDNVDPYKIMSQSLKVA